MKIYLMYKISNESFKLKNISYVKNFTFAWSNFEYLYMIDYRINEMTQLYSKQDRLCLFSKEYLSDVLVAQNYIKKGSRYI